MGWIGRSMGWKQKSMGRIARGTPLRRISNAKTWMEVGVRINRVTYSAQSVPCGAMSALGGTPSWRPSPPGQPGAGENAGVRRHPTVGGRQDGVPPMARPHPQGEVRHVETRFIASLTARTARGDGDEAQHERPQGGRAISNRGWSAAEPAEREHITNIASKRRLCHRPPLA